MTFSSRTLEASKNNKELVFFLHIYQLPLPFGKDCNQPLTVHTTQNLGHWVLVIGYWVLGIEYSILGIEKPLELES